MNAARSLRYERDPDEIYRQSFAAIEREAALERVPADLRAAAIRMIHACGMPDIVSDLVHSPGAGAAGRQALAAGRPVFCDVEMVKAGILSSRLPAGNDVICTLNDPRAAERGRAGGITRSAAAVELWGARLAGAVAVIGNAPTALFRLLELLDEGAPKPALIVAMPVGFVGAAESKAELAADPRDCEFLALAGRRGGSAIAAAAINALGSRRQ
jgi:precorrin-8X/cobalt-precorrin-8 methylmutase